MHAATNTGDATGDAEGEDAVVRLRKSTA